MMKRLAGALMLIAAVAAVGGGFLTVNYTTGWADVGKALMTLAVSAFIGGVVATLLKVIERDRQKRETWSQLLRDVVDIDQTLAAARQLIKAHKTAKTYSEQHKNIVDARLVLRRVWIHPLVADDRERLDLRGCLDQMKSFVDDLGNEYEQHYLPVARQQRLDERYLKDREEKLGAAYPSAGWPEDSIYQPTRAWNLLTDEGSQFPVLRELIGDRYGRSCFVQAFLQLRPMLETRAGIKRHSDSLESTVP
jgi:hypothetical protein